MMQKIRVLHLANVVNKNDFVDSLVSHLNRDQFEVFVVTFTNKSANQYPDYEHRNIKHIVLNIYSRRQYLKGICRLLAIIKENKIDILHTHMFDEALLGGFLKILNPQIRFVLGRHYSDEIYLTSNGWRRERSLLVESFANRQADKIITVSSFINKLLLKQKVNERKIFRTTYGFDFSQDRYTKPNENQIDELRNELQLKDKFVVLNIGRHYFLKRQDLLIQAFDTFAQGKDDMRLVLVGGGPWSGYLRKLTRERELEEKVIFLGWRKDVAALINLADVVVQPTMTEAFPQIMIEVMAHAKPLVISKVSGPDDQVKHGETGYLIDPGEVNDIREALEYIYSNREFRLAIGEKASAYVRKYLNIKKVIKDYERLYMELMNLNRATKIDKE